MQILHHLIIITVFLTLTACLGSNQPNPIPIKLEGSAAKDTKVFVQLGHYVTVNSLAFSPDGKFVLSGSMDKTIKLWESKTGREIRTFRGHSQRVNAVAFSPDGQFILSGSDDNTLKLWGPNSCRLIHTFQGHTYDVAPDYSGLKYGITTIAFSPDGKLALSGSDKNQKIILWDVKSGREIRAFEGSLNQITAVAFSPDGKFAFAALNEETESRYSI